MPRWPGRMHEAPSGAPTCCLPGGGALGGTDDHTATGGNHADPPWHRRSRDPCFPSGQNKAREAMADLQKLLFEDKAKVSDREVLATARLNARVKVFAGRPLAEDMLDEINAAVADEADRLIADGVLRERPDWLAAIVGRRLYVAFGARAVQQLSRELKDMGAV